MTVRLQRKDLTPTSCDDMVSLHSLPAVASGVASDYYFDCFVVLLCYFLSFYFPFFFWLIQHLLSFLFCELHVLVRTPPTYHISFERFPLSFFNALVLQAPLFDSALDVVRNSICKISTPDSFTHEIHDKLK